MWQLIKNYLSSRWAEPETKAATTTAVGVTAAYGIGHLGLGVGPDLGAVVTTDVTSLIVAVLPGPISSAIIKQLFGANVPPHDALRWHKSQK